TQGVFKAMFLTKLKIAFGACSVALLVLTSAFALRTSAGDKPPPVAPKDRLADAPPVKQEPPPVGVPKNPAPSVPPAPELPLPGPGPLDLPIPARATPWKAGVRASSDWDDKTPEKAFDGNLETMWNSCGYAPGWIEKDLGSPSQLISIALYISQTPDGMTI